jgi:hypothetical protein
VTIGEIYLVNLVVGRRPKSIGNTVNGFSWRRWLAGTPGWIHIIRCVVGNVRLAGAIRIYHMNLVIGAEFEKVC